MALKAFSGTDFNALEGLEVTFFCQLRHGHDRIIKAGVLASGLDPDDSGKI